jgi:Ca-activated chloride channel homolog
MAQKVAPKSAAGSRRSAVGISLLAVFAILGSSELRAESLASKVREGNRLFAQGKYAKAETAYMDAQVKNPGKPEVLYNLGNSLIKQKKYSQGVQSLRQSANKGDKVIRESSWYNAGNALFEAGRFQDSAEAFVQSLKLDPSDKDAKHNLELALLKLKEQQQAAANQKPKNSDNSKQDKSSSGKNGQQQRQQSEKEGLNKSGGNKDQADSAKQQESSKIQRPGSVSKEQAAQILDAVRAQELEQQRKLLEMRARRRSNGKDW